MASNNYRDFPIITLSNPLISLDLLSGGAHIIGLRYRGGSNLFAELFEQKDTGFGDYYSLGGHRLWHSPEAMPRTYLPNIGEAQVTELPNGVRITRPPEPVGGIVKQIDVQLEPKKAIVTVRHELANRGLWPIECAAWALTMFRLGGIAILPLPNVKVDLDGLLPNRQLTLWPYTRINDPRLNLQDDFITLRADPLLPPIKLGYFNPHGWLAYWLEGTLFIKRFNPETGSTFPDGGCNAEVYCNDKFIELESLGPLGRLKPGESLVHTETWELYESLEQSFIPDRLRDLLVQPE